MGDEIKRLSIAEFRALGYLQEVNRLVLHPCGLALEVEVDDDTGEERLGGVWDYREDPEGITYGDGIIDPVKAMTVEQERRRHDHARIALWGSITQPLTEEGASP